MTTDSQALSELVAKDRIRSCPALFRGAIARISRCLARSTPGTDRHAWRPFDGSAKTMSRS